MPLTIKICGLKTPETLDAALQAGADMVGFVFFEKSPRHIDPVQALNLSQRVGGKALKVALLVDADDKRIIEVVDTLRPDWLQLHGAETPARVADIRANFRLPVLKAIGIADEADLLRATIYKGVADRLLFDAKPPKNAVLPGGNGLAFDWALLRDFQAREREQNWMLSGGLTPENVETAISLTGAPGVDVSSGVESPQAKNPRNGFSHSLQRRGARKINLALPTEAFKTTASNEQSP